MYAHIIYNKIEYGTHVSVPYCTSLYNNLNKIINKCVLFIRYDTYFNSLSI